MRLYCCSFVVVIFLVIVALFASESIKTNASTSIASCKGELCNSAPVGFPLPYNEYTITAGFMAEEYYKEFHKWHTGIDLIPNSLWYKINNNATEIKLASTMYGTLKYNYNSCDGYAAIVVNHNYLIYLGHISKFLLPENSEISPGEYIALMGHSGTCQTGEHVHYEIHKKVNNQWILVNPLNYLY